MKCSKHHIIFQPIGRDSDVKAFDTWCGHEVNGDIWYCSKECMERGEEGTPLTYRKASNEPIMID